MAVSTNFTTSNQYVWFWLQVDLTSQDVSLNRSYVRIRIWAQRTAGYETYGSGVATFINYTGGQYTATIYPSQKITSTPVCLFDQNHYVIHDAAGNASPSFGASFNIPYVVGGAAQYHTFPLPQIQRAATISSVNSGSDFGSQINVNWSGNAAFTYQLVFAAGSSQDSLTTSAGASSASFTPPLSWLANWTNSTTTGVSIELRTLYNGSQIGASSWYALYQSVPANAAPTISTPSLSHVDIYPDDPVPTGWGYVQTRSGVTVNASSAGAYGSTITSMTIGGGGYSNAAVSVSNGSGSRTFGALNNSGINTFTVSVTDSRGRTASTTANITVNAYSRPQITNVLTQRATSGGTQDANGTYALGKATYTFSAVGSNAVVRNVNYRESGATTWTDASVSFNSGTAFLIAGGFDILKSYEIAYIVDDQFNTVIYTDILSVATPILHFKKGGLMAAIFKRVGTFIGLDIGSDVNIDGELTLGTHGRLHATSGKDLRVVAVNRLVLDPKDGWQSIVLEGPLFYEYTLTISVSTPWSPGSGLSGRSGYVEYDTGMSGDRLAALCGHYLSGWLGVVFSVELYKVPNGNWWLYAEVGDFTSTSANRNIVLGVMWY